MDSLSVFDHFAGLALRGSKNRFTKTKAFILMAIVKTIVKVQTFYKYRLTKCQLI